MSEARIFIGPPGMKSMLDKYRGQHCLVEPFGPDEHKAPLLRCTFDDGVVSAVLPEEVREYTIADHNHDQSEHYRTHPRVDAVD